MLCPRVWASSAAPAKSSSMPRRKFTPTLKKQYQCLCGARDCRGTMLALRKRNRT